MGSEQLEAMAHVLRRTTFGPFPGATERASERHDSVDDLVEATLAADPMPLVLPDRVDEAPFDAPETNDYAAFQTAWIERMSDDAAGLHEKMTWFWHTHFTTSVSKAATTFCWRQLGLLHREALGNFRDLCVAMCTDAAMLQWLDGASSSEPQPNENFARELMELFMIGRGNYTEDDVRASARAMAGWSVDQAVQGPIFIPNAGLQEPVTFMGERRIHTPESIVDRILTRAEVAPFVVAKLARFLVGGGVSDRAIAGWASTFRADGYEIAPVVAEILRSEEFAASRHARNRHGIEWLCTVLRACRLDVPPSWAVQEWGQFPYWPLNVAGWPDRWSSASSLYARASFLAAKDVRAPDFGDADDPVVAAAAHCGLFELSASSRRALQREWDERGEPVELLRATLATPEFVVA